MPRENSFSDSEGRSLTPDPEDAYDFSSGPAQDERPAIQPTTASDPAQSQSHSHPHMPHLHIPHPHLGHALSPRSPNRGDTLPTPSRRSAPGQRTKFETPTDRFRATVRKVMAMRRTSSFMARGGVGAEPGIDPRRASANLSYGHIKQQCLIEVVDYSTVRTSFGRMTNQEFVRLLADPAASKREPWVKVRWINIGGISWDVISALAIKYDLHPLALEDVLHQRGHARSKADYYPQHLFLRVLCHTLGDEDDTGSVLSDLPRSESPEPADSEGEALGNGYDDEYDDDAKTAVNTSTNPSRYSSRRGRGTIRRKFGASPAASGDLESTVTSIPLQTQGRFAGIEDSKKANKNARNRKLVRELKRGDRVNVNIAPMCMFLFRDGTVISMHKDTTLGITSPITDRLRQRDTGLRTTADPSLLVESLLDLIVDQALEIVEEYQNRILKIEQAVLVKPSVVTVRRLHILQGDLVLHKRTLEPIKTMIYGLRRYDADRVLALKERYDSNTKVEGYMSHKSKIYLADVHDHMEYILTSLDMVAGITENLINYTFNMASYEMNEVMRRLTLATIIFLPLTLLTGYFGMNFTSMWSVNANSDLFFWEIAIPLMLVVIVLFSYNDLKRVAHYMEKRLLRKKIDKTYKRD